jgi:hypothetical protein
VPTDKPTPSRLFLTFDLRQKQRRRREDCDISDSSESLCLVQHEKAEREKDIRERAKLASKGILLNDPTDRLSTEGTHVLPVNDEVTQTIIQNGSKIDNVMIDVERNNACLDDGWKQVSRHENTRKKLARNEGNKATD